MIALVPVSRFRIEYEAAAGRPFSQLERMILRAVREGATDLVELQRIFEVHPRILIEGLVTLTHAGWLAVGGPGQEGFVLTSEGSEAAGTDQPPSTTEVFSRQTFVVMERLTGALIPNKEVRFVSRRDLGDVWNQTVRLPAEIFDNRLDEGQVQHLLPKGRGEWVRWIGPIDMLSKDAHWLPVNVDLDMGTIVGLPDAWSARLRPNIFDGVGKSARSLNEKAMAETWELGSSRHVSAISGEANAGVDNLPGVGWPVTLAEGDFCFEVDEHEQLLIKALEEGYSLFIASAFGSVAKLDLLRPNIETALQRGASIDLLWGHMADAGEEERALAEWLKKLVYSAQRDGLKGKIRFNRSPSGSHANLLIWDGPSGYQGYVGSYNWLSPLVGDVGNEQRYYGSVHLTDSAALASLARCAATLWSDADSEVLTSTGDRWRRIATELDKEAALSDRTPTNAMVRLVLDREHEFLLREWKRTAQLRLLVTSQRLDEACEERLVSGTVERSTDFIFDALYGHADVDGVALAKIYEKCQRSGCNLKEEAAFHLNVVISDMSVCITSYNFLSAKPFGASMKARELGIEIEGVEPAEWLWNRLQRNGS